MYVTVLLHVPHCLSSNSIFQFALFFLLFLSPLKGFTVLWIGALESFEELGCNTLLVGGFKYFSCSPLFGEDEPILTSIFFNWLETTN